MIAITDHDCMAATVRGKMLGEKNGIKVIPGVEISCTDKIGGKPVHLICYSADNPDRLEGLCHSNQVIRKKAGQIMMLKAAAKFGINPDFIMKRATGSTNLYRQHIMHALMDAGFTNSICGELYKKLFSPDSMECIAVNPAFPSPEDVLADIHNAGGIAVLAHPAHYGNFDTLDRLAQIGLDGVEVYHPTSDNDDISYLLKFAKEHKLLVTGGSDFHGMYNKSCVTVGSYGISDKQLDDFLSFKARKKRQQKRLEAKAAENSAVVAE